MQNSQLVVIVLGDKERLPFKDYISKSTYQPIKIEFVDHFEIDDLLEKLNSLKTEKSVLIISNPNSVTLADGFEERLISVQELSRGVLFPASLLMDFTDPILHYFYWKHYPRPHSHYNFLDARTFFGSAKELTLLLKEVELRYGYSKIFSSLDEMLSRYYADSINEVFSPEVEIKLDHDQQLIASTFRSSVKKSKKNWLYQTLFRLNELNSLKSSEMPHMLNIQQAQDGFTHNLTWSSPAVVCTNVGTANSESEKGFKKVKSVWFETLKQLAYVAKVNRGVLSKERIFRNAPNKSIEIDQATKRIVERLAKRLPVSFAHYNDGELTFIRDFLAGNHHNEWFGRKQQQYDPLLAERLYGAMKFQKEGYFVGVPCSIDHPKLRLEADAIVGDYDHKVQAMSLHHNLFYMPHLIESLKGRQVYFFVNEFQDLSLFEKLGVEVNPERITKVPFRNSYLEYDNYKDQIFAKDSVVVLMCGMLAKILTKVWFENQSHISTLALGASLDDHIQIENIGFELYPERYPVTRNTKKYRSFLFGPKPLCKECFDY